MQLAVGRRFQVCLWTVNIRAHRSKVIDETAIQRILVRFNAVTMPSRMPVGAWKFFTFTWCQSDHRATEGAELFCSHRAVLYVCRELERLTCLSSRNRDIFAHLGLGKPELPV